MKEQILPMHIRLIALWLGLAATPGFAVAAHAQYDVTVLQAPSGSGAIEPYAINASGQTVGGSNGSVQDALLWSPTGKATVLQDVGGIGIGRAVAINASGEIAGISNTPNDGQEAVLWSATGTTVLQDVGGEGRSGVSAINASGQIVGASGIDGGNGNDAVLWAPSGKATVLSDPGGQGNSQAIAINASGHSVGVSYLNSAHTSYEAVLWSQSGKATVLQDVGGQGASTAVSVNASGYSVGSSETSTGQDAVLWSPTGKATVLQGVGGVDSIALHINASGQSVGVSGGQPVLWSPSGKATVLQTLGFGGMVSAINASGQSVGVSSGPSGNEAVLWSSSGAATDLGAVLGAAWSDSEAIGFNNRGDIVGEGVYDGVQTGFLLTPVSASPLSASAAPELSTWAMLLVGFAGLGLAGYRRGRPSSPQG
jgi:hypothetical protein